MHTVNTIPLTSGNLPEELPPFLSTKLLDRRIPRRFLRRLPGRRVFSVNPSLGCPSDVGSSAFVLGGVQ